MSNISGVFGSFESKENLESTLEKEIFRCFFLSIAKIESSKNKEGMMLEMKANVGRKTRSIGANRKKKSGKMSGTENATA